MDSKTMDIYSRPKYWLMFGLPWPEEATNETVAKAAHVLAPPLIAWRTRDALPFSAGALLDCADAYARKHTGQRLVWFSDLTRSLEWERGRTWDDLGIDWEEALADLRGQQILGVDMNLHRFAHFHLINTARTFELFHHDGTSQILTDEEREKIRDYTAEVLDSEWPRYIREMVSSGRLA